MQRAQVDRHQDAAQSGPDARYGIHDSRDLMQTLPYEIILNVFINLSDLGDIHRLAQVSRRYYAIFMENDFGYVESIYLDCRSSALT